jgi:hypothetical protein
MKTFKFYWLDGKTDIGEGVDVADAFRSLGFGAGAISALDYFEEVK